SSCVLTLRREISRREISEPDVARAKTILEGNRPAETGRAGRPARRKGLVPAGLHCLADRVGTRRQTREPIVAVAVGHRRCSDRAGHLNTPTRETGVRRGRINVHLAVDRRGPTGRAGVHAGAAGSAAGSAAGTATASATGSATGSAASRPTGSAASITT